MKKRILCYGDSNTWGYNPRGGRYDEATRWPMVLQTLLGSGYHVIEEGLNGRTFSQDDPTEGGFKSGIAYLPPCLMTHNPIDVVAVMLGTNDTKERFGLNAETIARNLNEFVRIVRSYATDETGRPPKILIISPPVIGEHIEGTPFVMHFGHAAHEKSLGFPDAYRRFSLLLQCAVLHASDYATSCREDAIHLTEEGHRALGRAVAQKILTMLS